MFCVSVIFLFLTAPDKVRTKVLICDTFIEFLSWECPVNAY